MQHARSTRLLAVMLLLALASPAITEETAAPTITPPPESLQLNPFYKKHISAGGFPIVASENVSDYALLEARYLVEQMLATQPKVREALIRNKVRLAIMAYNELTTDIPEHADLTPKAFWDRRARGLGATRRRPAVSCGEENLLGYRGDPYAKENILIHEFAHAMHHMGLNTIDTTFEQRLKKTYDEAMAAGLWKGKYAATNRAEYFAEGVQSWFDTNRENDHDHNHVNTRQELKEYDPGLAKLCEEVFGDGDWRYVRPQDRPEPGHLAGYDRANAPRFAWPQQLKQIGESIKADAVKREREANE